MLNRVMNRYASFAPLALRVTTGVIFLLHGAQKLFGLFNDSVVDNPAQIFTQAGFTPGYLWVWMAGLLECFGGLALLLGVFTRYAALLLAVEMLVALVAVHLPHGFFLPQGMEFAFALFGASVTLLLSGAGAWALDSYLQCWWQQSGRGGWRNLQSSIASREPAGVRYFSNLRYNVRRLIPRISAARR